jgi:hypothetical protein
MADIIFPNTYQDDSFESETMFKGIDWDNFNEKLAQVKEGSEQTASDNVSELLRALKKTHGPEFEEVAAGADHGTQSNFKVSSDEDDKDSNKCADCDCDPCECDDDKERKSKMIKHAPDRISFTHPNQLSAEAVEAALASGNQILANTILAARHERRVILAEQIQRKIEASNSKQLKLAQRKAYRESLLKTASVNNKPKVDSRVEKTIKTAKAESFVKVSNMTRSAKQAFAEKAMSHGFPSEYVQAILGEAYSSEERTLEIKNVMASNLDVNIKKSAVESMVKTATLTNADYSRIINYWKNELGYGDVEWIDALFTKKYD